MAKYSILRIGCLIFGSTLIYILSAYCLSSLVNIAASDAYFT